MLSLAFGPFGPPRPTAAFVPPPGMRLQGYALAYDEDKKRTLHVIAHDYGAAFGDVYAFDGSAWQQLATGDTAVETKQELHGFYDPTRKGVVLWNFKYDYEKGRVLAMGMRVDERAKLEPIETQGEGPVAEPEDEDAVGTFDTLGLYAFDRGRNVTACLTRRGVWELGPSGAWTGHQALTETIPQAWNDDGSGAVYDPVGKRIVFWMFTREPEYEYAFFAWDGRTLSRLPTKGLPEKKLHMGLFNPAAVIGAHPELGLLLLAGPHGMFAFKGDHWEALPETQDPPPRMTGGRMIYDPNAKALIVGPGYHEGDGGGREAQAVFYVLRGRKWERMGTVSAPSPLADMSNAFNACVAGTWVAVARRDLQTLEWRDSGFVEVGDEKKHEAVLGSPNVEGLLDCDGKATVVTTNGGVLELVGKSWNKVSGPSKVFGNRSEPCLAYDGKRIVAWGGSVNNRPANDVLIFADGQWKKPKTASALPKDKRGRDAPFVDFTLFYDGALGTVVRLGHKDVAVLEGEVMRSLDMKGYTKLAGGRSWQHLPAHDPRTGETLVVQLETGAVLRFDLAGCVQVATLAMPEELAPKKQHDSGAHVALERTLCFDPTTRTLHAQDPKENVHRYAVDLGPAFDAAKKLGPRKLLGAPRAAPGVGARLYNEKTRTFFFVDGKKARSGKIGEAGKAETLADPEKAIAAKGKAGLVDAGHLSIDFLASLAAEKTQELTVKGKQKTLPSYSVSRIGGLPSGIDEKRWPMLRKAPMGFLFQLSTGKLLKKHAGVAVFCVTDSTCTEDTSLNRALLVTAAEWKKKPLAKSPGGVEVLAIRPILADDERYELVDDRVEKLAKHDPAMTDAFDRFQRKAKVLEEASSKLGGVPEWVQGPEGYRNYRFVAQLDFDQVNVDAEWGLAGCLYILVHPDEKDAVAMWQYT